MLSQSSELADVEYWAEQLTIAKHERRHAILKAYSSGWSLRAIAAAAGTSFQYIHQVIREPEPVVR